MVGFWLISLAIVCHSAGSIPQLVHRGPMQVTGEPGGSDVGMNTEAAARAVSILGVSERAVRVKSLRRWHIAIPFTGLKALGLAASRSCRLAGGKRGGRRLSLRLHSSSAFTRAPA